MKTELNKGLEAGLTINEIKEVLVHLYAYCGFPRSIRGLQTFMEVLEERKTKGINDETGREASPIHQEPGVTAFPKGEKINSNNFTGTVYLFMMLTPDNTYNTSISAGGHTKKNNSLDTTRFT